MNPLVSLAEAAQLAAPHRDALEDSQRVVSLALPTNNRGDDERSSFPMKLHMLLHDPAVHDAISWMPHGESFIVLNVDVFTSRILPHYFAIKKTSGGVHKYPSFTRKLNRWGFRQVSHGPNAGEFHHELFRRDNPELCRGMVCQRSRKSMQHTKKDVSDSNRMMSSATFGSFTSCSTIAAASVSTAGGSSISQTVPPKKMRHLDNCATNDFMVVPPTVSRRNSSWSTVSTLSPMEGTYEYYKPSVEADANPLVAGALSSLFYQRGNIQAALDFSRSQCCTKAPSQLITLGCDKDKSTNEATSSKRQYPILETTTDTDSASFAPAITLSQEQFSLQAVAQSSLAAVAKGDLLKAYSKVCAELQAKNAKSLSL